METSIGQFYAELVTSVGPRVSPRSFLCGMVILLLFITLCDLILFMSTLRGHAMIAMRRRGLEPIEFRVLQDGYMESDGV